MPNINAVSENTEVTVKNKRKPGGRPKADYTYNRTIQLRLNDEQLDQLTEQARQKSVSRSDIIRAALRGVRVMQAAPSAEERENYRQLVRLSNNLNQLVPLARKGQEVEGQLREVLAHLDNLLIALNH